jgi:glycosyltransferase involved in cell wall biosynthesis
MHSRPASLKILKIGLKPQARSLYLRTAVWNLQQERVRYLLSFLFLGVLPKYVQNVLEAKDDASTLDVPQGKPSFSVVIPTYNRSAWLREALESIFQQVFEDYEVIVVDDGSTDDTSQMLRQYGNRLVCLTQKNLGPGTARNLGVKHAKGRYIAFLDSDDLWFPWTLATYERIAREQDWPAFISGEHFLFTDTKELALVKKEPVEYATFSNYLASAKSWSWYGVSSFVIRRDEFERVEGFAKKWINAEDADFALRMSVSPGFITVHSPVTFGFRTHDGGQTQHLSKTLAGAEYLIQREVSEHYAGGRAKKRERIEIITRHVRPVALQLLNLRMHNEAWRLYWASLYWHLRLRRLKFLAGFLLKACFNR